MDSTTYMLTGRYPLCFTWAFQDESNQGFIALFDQE